MDAKRRQLPKKRTPNFGEQETKLLIKLWGSPAIQKKLFLTHVKTPVMQLLANNLKEYGYHRTAGDIKTKIRNLKCFYHRIKRSMVSSNGIVAMDTNWVHFQAMDEILGKRHPFHYDDNSVDEIEEGNIRIKEEVNDFNGSDNGSGSNANVDSKPQEETPLLNEIKPDSPINGPRIYIKDIATLMQPCPESTPKTENIPAVQPTLLSHTKPRSKIVTNPQSTSVQPTILLLTQPTITIPQATRNQSTILKQSQAVPKSETITIPNMTAVRPMISMQPHQSSKPETVTIPQTTIVSSQTPNVSNDNVENNIVKDEDQYILLKQLIEAEEKSLNDLKQAVTMDKERFEHERRIGDKIISVIPVLDNFLKCQKLSNNKGEKRKLIEDKDICKDRKLLRTVLEQGINMMQTEKVEKEKSRNNW